MNIEDIENLVLKNCENLDNEYRRIFHGRGNYYEGFEFLTIDSVDKVLYVAFFKEIDKDREYIILNMLKKLYDNNHWQCLVLQRRYLQKAPSEILFGEIKDGYYAIENGLRYKVNFLSNQNIGFFADMKKGREFVSLNAKDKNVLNLFSYTCAFSVVAVASGAKNVVNVDMAKGALNIGRENHRINSLSTKDVNFLPYNILKSWSRIRKFAPYDLIIIDPPSFQKGSFIATNDYIKIVRKLPELCSKNGIILSSLNAPELNENFIIDIFRENASEFSFERRLDNDETFPQKESSKSLKNLIFKRAG